MTVETISPAPGWQTALNPQKIHWINRYLKDQQTILELGSGKGFYTEYMTQLGKIVTSVDQSQAQDHQKHQEWNLECPIPLNDESFDAIVAFDVLEHIHKDQQLISEMNRLLKKGGQLLISVPHSDDHLIAPYYLTYAHHKDKTHVREYTPEVLKQQLESYAFQEMTHELTGGDIYAYSVLGFIHNPIVKWCTRLYLAILKKSKFLSVKNCHGDIFAVFKKR
jgi:2-polyprenyl-3-methyl-5-hydroxy-6-metoxy-1,4-benzoquinol methylase